MIACVAENILYTSIKVT